MGIIHCMGARHGKSPCTACYRRYTAFAWPCPASHLSDVANFAAVVGDIEIPHVVAVEQQAPRGRVVEAQKELMPSFTRLHDRPVSETVTTTTVEIQRIENGRREGSGGGGCESNKGNIS